MGKIGGTIQETLLPVIKRLLPIVKGVSDAFHKAPAPVKALVVAFGAITVALGVLAPVITAVATVLPMLGVGAPAVCRSDCGCNCRDYRSRFGYQELGCDCHLAQGCLEYCYQFLQAVVEWYQANLHDCD